MEATRLRILEAARSIVGGKGDLDGLSMEAVAAKAGVSRMTVYYQFHSRADLFEALADQMAERGGMNRMREVFTEPDSEAALRKLVETFVEFWATDRVTMRRLRAIGVVSPSQHAGPRSRDAWRREAIVNLLAKNGEMSAGPKPAPPADLVDLLTALTSFETFDALCTNSRDPEAVATQLSSAAALLLRADPPARVQRRRTRPTDAG
ncbi:MAG: TetR/AcrR family transcriptional regulator [Thermoplasmata archaeon]